MSIADEIEIRNLVSRLAVYADGNDVDGYLTLLTEDAEWHTRMHKGDQPPIKGHSALKAGALKRRADGVQGAGSQLRHLVTTLAIDVKGDTATGQCYLLTVRKSDQTPVSDALAVYEDEYRKTKDGWKLAKRTISRG